MVTIKILLCALNVTWYNSLRLGTLEEAALWMKEGAGYTFKHGTFEVSVGHLDRVVLQDSKTDIDLGIITEPGH